MRLSSRIIRIIFLIAVFISTTILVYAAATISNPLCSLEQVTNFPNIGMGHYMASISGDGNRAAVGAAPIGTDTEIWNLSTNTSIDIIDGAGFPVLDYDGSRIAFYSRDNLTGQNAAGTYELFLWENGTITQLTSFADPNITIAPPDISDDGTKIVFATSPGTNPLGNIIKNYYIWREGSGISALIANPTTAETPAFAYTPIRITADGNHAVFVHDSQLSPDAPTGSGFVYKMNLTTGLISYLFEIETFEGDDEADMSFMFIDADASRIAFSSPEDYVGQNPDNELLIWIWDETDGFRSLDNGPDMPIYYYLFSMGFSADGNRLLFTSAFDPTGENPDGTFEYYIYEYPSDSIRQISSRTGLPMLYPANEGLSADGTKAVISLPPGTDYEPDDPAGYEVEMFEAICGASASLPAPDNLRSTSIAQTSISLTWDDNTNNESYYRIESSSNGGTSWHQVGSVSADTTSFTNSSLTCNTDYMYRVRAYSIGMDAYSTYSNSVSATTLVCTGSPAAPSNLRTTSTSYLSISLAWNDNATNESNYYLQRSSDGGSTWVTLTFGANVTSHTDGERKCGTSYQYRVRAYRSTNATYSAYTPILSTSTVACLPPPLAPGNLRATTIARTVITLEWDDVSDETSYHLEYSNNNGATWNYAQTLAENVTSYTRSALFCNTTYLYRVRATRSLDNGISANSNVLTVTTLPCPIPPNAPSNLRLVVATRTGISIAWDDNATDETVYYIERNINGGSPWHWTQIAWQNANTTIYGQSGLTCNTNYQYRVRAGRFESGVGTVYSDYSAVLSVNTADCSAFLAPGNLRTSNVSSFSLRLEWNNSNNDATSTLIERSTDGITWVQIASLSSNYWNYQNTGLQCNTTYDYRVRAYRSSDDRYSPYSSVVTVTTSPCPPIAPTNLTTTVNYLTVNITWTDNSNDETSFEVVRVLNGESQVVASLPPNSTSYQDIDVVPCHRQLYYRIRAVNATLGVSSALTGSAFYLWCPPLLASSLSSTNTVNSITLNWTTDITAQSFILSYNNGFQWFTLATFDATTTSYTHNGLGCSQNYQYRIETIRNRDNKRIFSDTFAFSTAACPPLDTPAAPVILSTQANLINLQIPAMPTGASSMNLERSLDGVNWLGIGLANGGYMDVNVVCATTYHYRLVAYRASDGQYSPASASVSTTTPACPVAVSMILGTYSAGTWSFVDSNATANPANTFNFGDASWQGIVGDWDGDGVDGIGLYRNGEFVLRSIVNGTVQESRFNFGESTGYQAVAGDWNGDGIDTIGVFGNGQFILSDDNINIHYRFNLGDGSGWQAIAGDWDGNGADGVALYKDGFWYLVDSAINPVSQSIAYGPAQAGWLPVAGDWNGDGIDTIGLYNNGTWRIRLESNTGGAEGSFFFGGAGAIPLSTFEGGIPTGDYSQEVFMIPLPEPELTPEATPES